MIKRAALIHVKYTETNQTVQCSKTCHSAVQCDPSCQEYPVLSASDIVTASLSEYAEPLIAMSQS